MGFVQGGQIVVHTLLTIFRLFQHLVHNASRLFQKLATRFAILAKVAHRMIKVIGKEFVQFSMRGSCTFAEVATYAAGSVGGSFAQFFQSGHRFEQIGRLGIIRNVLNRVQTGVQRSKVTVCLAGTAASRFDRLQVDKGQQQNDGSQDESHFGNIQKSDDLKLVN